MKICIALMALTICVQATAQPNVDSIYIKKIANHALIQGKAYTQLRVLCKQIGHRLSGSPAMYKAEAWGSATLAQYGADTVYTQPCQVTHWVRGAKENGSYKWISQQGETVQTAEKNIDILSLGNAVGTGAQALKADVLLINNFEELEAKKDQAKGKIVFFNYAFDQTYIRTSTGYGNAVTYRTQGASKAAKYGAVASIVRSVSTSPDNNPHTGTVKYNDSFAKIPAFAVGVQDADNMAQLLKTGKLIVTLQSSCATLPDTLAHNIIAEIRGAKNPNNIITIGGHLDSWDVGEGAQDDGAGVVQSMEVINILKSIGYTPNNTIRVVLFANEENGLGGGNMYASQAGKGNQMHIAAIETDAGGYSPRKFGGSKSDVQYAKFKAWLPLLFPYGIDELTQSGGGADIGPLYTLYKTPTIGLQTDGQRYFDLHHSKTDVYENVNKRELHLGAATITALVYLIDKYGL